MKINKQPYLMLGILFAAITILLSILYALNYVNGETLAMSVGVTELLIGFNQINMAQKKDSKGRNKGNKKNGVLYVIVGIIIIINVIIRLCFN